MKKNNSLPAFLLSGLLLLSFLSCEKIETRTVPVVTTSAVVKITDDTASCGGNVIEDGGYEITARGVCWNTSENPTTDNNKTSDGSGKGEFTSLITGIPYGTIYIRAYAVTSRATFYGRQVSYTRIDTTGVPVVVTTAPVKVNDSIFTIGGNITSDGGFPVTARGVCWGFTKNPTIQGDTTSDGTGTGAFTSRKINIPFGKTYIRAYAINSKGTAYGEQDSIIRIDTSIKVGNNYEGGIIGYIFQSGDVGYKAGELHGIIVAASDQSTGIVWTVGTNVDTYLSGTIEIGMAKEATESIVNIQGAGNYAAKLCYDLSLNGYNDWLLPTTFELKKIYQNRALIGGFASAKYWSSTEFTIDFAWVYSFDLGTDNEYEKKNTAHVRAIRYF